MHKSLFRLIPIGLFLFCLWGDPNPARAWDPVVRPWTALAHESQIVGIIRIEGVMPGEGERPPLLHVKLVRLFKGEYSSKSYNLDKLFLDLTGKIHPHAKLDSEGKSLGMEYKEGKLFLAYMSPAKLETFLSQRVMTLSGWAIMTLQPINHNILGYDDDRESGFLLRHTYDFLNALDRFCEIDALEGDERKVALQLLEKQLKRYPNGDLHDAFRWFSAPPKTSSAPPP